MQYVFVFSLGIKYKYKYKYHYFVSIFIKQITLAGMFLSKMIDIP